MSYGDVLGLNAPPEGDKDLQEGETVTTWHNSYPQYYIVAIRGNRVWLRNVYNHSDFVADIANCRRVRNDNS